MKDGQTPNKQTDSDKQEATFDEIYVKELREENKKYRLKAKESEEKLKDIEAKLVEIEETKKKEKGEFKELYEKTKKEMETLQSAYKSAEETLSIYKQKEEKARAKLIESLPTEYRGTFKSATMEQIEAFKKTLSVPREPKPQKPQSEKNGLREFLTNKLGN